MAEIEEEVKPALRSAMKNPDAPKKEKKAVSVGFGGDSDDDAPKGKGKKDKEKDKDKKESKGLFGLGKDRKGAEDVEENLRVNVQEIDHSSWLKKTQSVSVFSDSPWGTLTVKIVQAKNVPQNSQKKCECFIRGNMGQAKYQTKTVKDKEKAPTWNEEFEMPCEPDEALKFKLYDVVGKGNRTPDITLGFLKVRIKNMRPGKLYDKWYDMKNDETLKDKPKIQLKLQFTLKIVPVITNKTYSKVYNQPTWVQSQRNPCYAENPTAAEMRWAVEKMAERIVQWYNSYDSFTADQRWKMNVMSVCLALGNRDLYGHVTYENRSRAPGQKSETLEYEPPELDDDDDDGYGAPKQYRQLGFISYHSIIPKDTIKKATDSKNSCEKVSLYAYKRRCETYPETLSQLIFKANTYLSENRDLQYLQTSTIQTNCSNHVVAWFLIVS